ncbi:MAG TPA: FAD-dependent oxidoreductase [Vicinamibacterales bacterium]|nr:FAD-dependent oxidoreductase [Vicinamibacterales bacterium]
MSAPARVVCLGGGFAAAGLARGLGPALRRGLVDLTVVSRDNFHTFHGFVGEMLGGRMQPEQIASPARRIFPAAAHFHNAVIEAIDVDARTVTTSRALDGRQYILSYDHLVIAIGSVDDLSRYPGIAEHALRLKTFWDCFKVRSHFLSVLEMAEFEPDEAERRRLLTFVIVGGNFGGVEVAAELQDFLRIVTRKEYRRIRPEEVRVIVVHSGKRILPELEQRHPPLVRYAERALARLGVEVRVGARLAAATPEEAVLNDGERIPTRSIISCAGTALSPLLDLLPFERDERGRVKTDATIRVLRTDHVWAAGDCAAVPHPRGGTCPTLAPYAMTQGETAGRNLARVVAGAAPKPYRFTGLGEACALGRRRAIAHVKGIRLYGLPAWVLWRAVFLSFVPTWDRKARILLDWLVTPWVGREIVDVHVNEPYGVRREHYEPGQDIVREGELGRSLYVIWTGEVEVLRHEDGVERTLAVLGPGQHFGERAVFQNVRRTATVRARTQVELLSLGEREAQALSTAMRPFGETISRLPNSRS